MDDHFYSHLSFSIVKPTEEGETTDEFTAQFTNCHGGQYNNLPNKQRYHIMYWMSNGKQLDMNSITRMEYEYYSFKYDHHRCGQGGPSTGGLCYCSNWDDEKPGRTIVLINSDVELNGFVVEYTHDKANNNPQAATCWLKRMIFPH